jgi:hypothetical protein
MELALQDLAISKATKPITAEDDPYKVSICASMLYALCVFRSCS